MYVSVGANGTLFSGSLRNWAGAHGVVPFDAPFDEHAAGRALDALGDAHDLSPRALREASITMAEGTIDLVVPRPGADYARAAEDVPRSEPHRFDGTAVFKTGEWQQKVYDPPAKFRKQRRPVPELYLDVERDGQHVVRFEHTLGSYGVKRHLGHHADDTGEIRAGQLADPVFRSGLARLVIGKARLLRFGRVAVPARPGMSTADRRRWEVVRGIEAAGGLDAALDAARSEHAAGLITENQKDYRLKTYRRLYRDPSITRPADLQAEFGAALDAVARTYAT